MQVSFRRVLRTRICGKELLHFKGLSKLAWMYDTVDVLHTACPPPPLKITSYFVPAVLLPPINLVVLLIRKHVHQQSRGSHATNYIVIACIKKSDISVAVAFIRSTLISNSFYGISLEVFKIFKASIHYRVRRILPLDSIFRYSVHIHLSYPFKIHFV
jgi:hypothetical protein